jgi:hypothetical protein
MLTDEICSEVLRIGADQRVTDIRVGLGYTAAALEDGRCGLAYTLHENEYESCTVIAEAGTLAGRKAGSLWGASPSEGEFFSNGDAPRQGRGLSADSEIIEAVGVEHRSTWSVPKDACLQPEISSLADNPGDFGGHQFLPAFVPASDHR